MVQRTNGSVRHFVYVSDRRLTGYVEKADDRPWRKVLGKVQLTLWIPIGPVRALLPVPRLARPLSSRPRSEQVEAAERSIRQASPVGDLASREPGHWISGRVAMDWAPIGDGRTVLFCGYAGPLIVAMFGSIEHMTGPTASTGIPGSDFRPIKAVTISGPRSSSFGPELVAAAREICDQPQPVRFLAEVIRRDTLAAGGPQREFLVARPLYIETAYDADESLSAPLRGTIRRFSLTRGWGLIEPDNGTDGVVVRSSELMQDERQTIIPNQRVEFRITSGSAGIEAISVRPTWMPAEEEAPCPSAPSHGQSAAFPGGGQIGPYSVRQRLGEGTMGVVYLAQDAAGTSVAIKLIRPEYMRDPEFLRRFKMEADSARRIRSANVARVIATVTEGELPYLATEYVAGLTLEEHVKRYGPLPNAAAVAAGIAAGIAAIHKADVIHRDLTPANVILSPAGTPVIIDFGLARARRNTQDLTQPGRHVGTLYYASPERVNRAHVSEAADIFSWAGITVFAATGSPPFGGEGVPLLRVAEKILNAPPDLGSISGNLRELLTAALSKDPRQRPTADQLLGRLTVSTSGAASSGRSRGIRRRAGILAAAEHSALFSAQDAGDQAAGQGGGRLGG
jgi:cold shock CspA family protein/predicted Ser/Thr protein kinase